MNKITFDSIPLDGTHEFTFGKHKGEAIEDVASVYLAWIANNHDDNQLISACQEELKYRDKFDCHIDEDEEYMEKPND